MSEHPCQSQNIQLLCKRCDRGLARIVERQPVCLRPVSDLSKQRIQLTARQAKHRLCPAHWRMVPKEARRLFSLACPRCEKDTSDKNVRRAWRFLRRCVAAADKNLGTPI